ncbi:hypothetical protein F4777DRAFT_581247 [Nemania sp. FL0916]|nr:hypothetical protein F4777DRAFT_581247 [Nemania sp. FL0916]
MLEHSTGSGHDEESWDQYTVPSQPDPEKKYHCPQCGSGFKRQENLKRHQRGHDGRSRFTCQICDKSFARSDILGRHTAIHNPRERRNDNPQRRRACRECARVRERYDPPSNITILPNNCSSSTSEAGDYDATGAGVFGPQTPLETPYPHYGGGEATIHAPGPSQWPLNGPQDAFGEPSMSSMVPNREFHSYQSNHPESSATSYFGYNALSHSNEGLYPASTSDIDTTNPVFTARDAGSNTMLGAYDRESNLTPKLPPNPSQMDIHQHEPVNIQGQYSGGTPFESTHLGNPFSAQYDHNSSSGAHTDLLGQPGALGSSAALGSYENLTNISAPHVSYDSQGAFFRTPYSSAMDSDAYGFVATAYSEPFQEPGPPT